MIGWSERVHQSPRSRALHSHAKLRAVQSCRWEEVWVPPPNFSKQPRSCFLSRSWPLLEN